MAAVPPAASDGASPTSRRGRPAVVAGLAGPKRLDIQGLRAVAVVAVLGFHSTETFTGGFLGVDVFFVISGYIIVDASGWAYTDRDHLSVVGAARLEDELHGLLADAAG